MTEGTRNARSPRVLAAVLLTALAVAGIVVAGWPDDGPRLPRSTADEAAAGGAVAATTTPASPPAAHDGAAADAPAARQDGGSALAGQGSLLVRVIWGDDRTPAAGLDVRVRRPGDDELLTTRVATTAGDGTVTFAELAPGTVHPQLERGRDSDHQRVEITAGMRSEITLVAKVGMHLQGRVVDGGGAPIAAADVVFADWTGGRADVVARSAADGTFALRGLKTHCHVGARKAGWHPSPLRQFTAAEGARVQCTIVLEPGGASLAGIVLGPDDRPVAGAVVRAGRRDQGNATLPDGSRAMAPQAEFVTTDAEGRFLVASAPVGELPLAARAAGLAPWQGTVQLAADQRSTITITLLAGATVSGIVRDEAGRPVGKASVMAGDWDDLGMRRLRTALDGSYRIDGLPVGTLPLQFDHDELGKAHTTLTLAPGEQRQWDAVLSRGLQLKGRVLDAKGAPAAKVMVEGQLDGASAGEPWFAFANTDADGRFAFDNCREGVPVRLTFRRKSTFPELVLAGQRPGPAELEIRLPDEAWLWITGTARGPDGEVLPHVGVSPVRLDAGSASPAETVDAATGAFRYGPYPPGLYTLVLHADGFPPIRVPERRSAGNETWDLGELRFTRGGTLVVHPIAAVPTAELSLRVRDDGGRWLEDLSEAAGRWRSGPLPPGNHTLQIGGPGIAAATMPFTIRPGEATTLDVPVRAGHPLRLCVVLPAGAAVPDTIELVIRRDDAVVWRGEAWSRDGKPETTLTLAAGRYQLEARSGALHASGAIELRAGEATATLELK